MTAAQRHALVADVLEFFAVSAEHKGRTKVELRKADQFKRVPQAVLYLLVDSLTDVGLLFRRGDGPKTVYATTRLGAQNIPKFREEAKADGSSKLR